MNTTIQLFLAFLSLSAIAFKAQAVSPAPDGGYPGGNTAEGQTALLSLTTGSYNTAVGFLSLRSDTTGPFNTAIGAGALLANTGGSNTAIGAAALLRNTTGSNNIALGVSAGSGITIEDNNIAIGHPAGGVSDTIYLGNFSHQTLICPAIGNQTALDAPVWYTGATGVIGLNTSSRRFKKDIEPMNNASEAILALKPVTFHYKSDEKNTPQFGLIAEEVAETNPALILRDKEGRPYSVRYEQVNAMLLNEFLKEHRKVEQQRKDFEAAIARQQKQIEALSAGLQKVSAQLELSKSAPQTVLKD